MADLRAASILLVEDNASDAQLTEEGVRRASLPVSFHSVRNGVEGVQFLKREGLYADAPRPDLILLDLNMPRMDGREFLGQVKENPRLRCIPVVVLTSSEAEEDVGRAYHLWANAYVRKPHRPEDFVELVRRIADYWLRIVRLPPDEVA